MALFFSVLFFRSWVLWRMPFTSHPIMIEYICAQEIVFASSQSRWMVFLAPMYYALAVMSKAAAMPVFLMVIVVEFRVWTFTREPGMARRRCGGCFVKRTAKERFRVLHTFEIINLFWKNVELVTSFLIMCSIALFAGWMHFSANDSLHETTVLEVGSTSGTAVWDAVLKGLSCVRHYYWNFIKPRACVHFFHAANVNTTTTTTGTECIVASVNFYTVIKTTLCVHIPIFKIAYRMSCTTSWKEIFRVLGLLAGFVTMLSPGIVAGSFGIHGGKDGGAAHDRYSLLAEALVAVPTLTIFLNGVLQLNVMSFGFENYYIISSRRFNRMCALRTKTGACCVVVLYSMFSLRLFYTYSPWQNTNSLWHHALLQNDQDVHALLSLGDAYSVGCQNQASCAQSLVFMERALQLDDKKSNGWYNYGATLYKTDRKVEALKAMQRALLLSPTDASCMDRVLRLAIETKHTNVFVSHYKKAVQLYRAMDAKGDKPLEFIMNVAASELSGTHGADVLQHVCTVAPSAIAWSMFGSLLHQKKNIKEAIVCYKKALLLEESMVDIVHNLGVAYYQNGDLAEANRVLREGMEKNPDDREMKKTWEMMKFGSS